MLGGVLGKRDRRGPTHTRLTVLRPPAPKNIAFNWQVGRDFTGPSRTKSGLVFFLSGDFQSNVDLKKERRTTIIPTIQHKLDLKYFDVFEITQLV